VNPTSTRCNQQRLFLPIRLARLVRLKRNLLSVRIIRNLHSFAANLHPLRQAMTSFRGVEACGLIGPARSQERLIAKIIIRTVRFMFVTPSLDSFGEAG
jgi:hypothetical protein